MDAYKALGGSGEQEYWPAEDELQPLLAAAENNPGLAQWLWDMYRQRKQQRQDDLKDQQLQQGVHNETLKRELRQEGKLRPLPETPEP